MSYYWRLSGLYFFYFASLGIIIPFWNLYLDDRGLSAQQIGFLGAILMGTKIISPSVLGWFSDRYKNTMLVVRRANFLALICFSALFLLPNATTTLVDGQSTGLASGQSFLYLCLVVFLFSFFWNGVIAQYEAVTIVSLGSNYKKYGLIRIWGSIGFTITVFLIGWYFNLYPISHVPWFMLGLLILIWLSTLSIYSVRNQTVNADSTKLFLDRLKQKDAILIFFACFLMKFSFATYYTFYTIYLAKLGYSQLQIGLLWGLSVTAEMISFLFAARMIQAIGLKNVLLLTFFVAALRWFLIPNFDHNFSALALIQLLHGASFAVYHAAAIEWVRRHFAKNSMAQGQAMYSAVSFGLGGAVGALLIGMLWTNEQSNWWAICWYVVALSAALGTLAIASVPKQTLEQAE